MAHLANRQDRAEAAVPPVILSTVRLCLDDDDDDYDYNAAEHEEVMRRRNDDEFMMYEFKIRRCPDARTHEWTSCPYAHPGEAARRRDPRRVAYTGDPCPELGRGPGAGWCPRGSGCQFAHGAFETWLHPSRYRTRPCRAGTRCPRLICFFAHTDKELREAGDFVVGAALSPRSMLSSWEESHPLYPLQRTKLQPTEVPTTEMEWLMFAIQEMHTRRMNTPAMAVLPRATEAADGREPRWVQELLRRLSNLKTT